MLATAALASASAAALRPLGASPSLRPPRAAALLRVQLAAARGAAGNQRRLPAVVVRASDKPGSEEGMAAVGSDLNWSHVARDVKRRLAAAVGGHESKQSQLQSWLKEAKLTHTGESDAEHNQAEIVAQTEAEFQDLDHLQLDVKSWMDSPEGENDERVVGLLTVRLLQAYHDGAGEPFDDENEDCVWRLGGFIPGWLVEALDHETLKRMIKAYMALPFSGV